MDRFKLTKQDRINQYKIIMYNVKGDLECYTRAVAKFPNVMYTHAADMAAAYIVGV